MVDASDLPWRVLSRRYDTHLCYTPMFHASNFIKDNTYRKENFPIAGEVTQGHPDYDRPLIVQFCANDPDVFTKAAQMVAKRGHYGSHMQEDWSLIRSMIEKARKNCNVRITAKIRKFDDDEITLRYAKMLQRAGVSILTIHGRTRDQRGAATGLAGWSIIRKVKQTVDIPVFANGNVQCISDVNRCIQETGVDGVMTAEGNLYNPAIFAGLNPNAAQVATEFTQIASEHKFPTLSSVRGHVFKMFHHLFIEPEFRDLRDTLASAGCFDDIFNLTKTALGRLSQYVESDEKLKSPENMTGLLALPNWRCKPYVRPSPNSKPQRKRPPESMTQSMKRKQMKAEKIAKFHEKVMNKEIRSKYPVCTKCPSNPRGLKCLFLLCRACCRERLVADDTDCPSHKLMSSKSREERKKQQEEFQAKRKKSPRL